MKQQKMLQHRQEPKFLRTFLLLGRVDSVESDGVFEWTLLSGDFDFIDTMWLAYSLKKDTWLSLIGTTIRKYPKADFV